MRLPLPGCGGGFYLLTAFTEDISTHRREMNAAAYKAQIYFDQREALLRYLGDSVLAGHPDAPTADSEGMRQVALDGPGGQPGQRLLLSARAEHTLQALQTHLLLVDARGAHWLAGDAVDVDLARLPSLRALQARNGSLEGADPVYWLRPGERGVALAKPVQAGPQPAQWLVLLLDADAAAGMIDGQGIGGYALLDRAGQPALSSQAPRLDRAGWTTLQQRQNDSFGTLWSGGLPRGVALVKGVGTDGWRLVYHLPPPLLLGDLAAPLLVCLLLLLLAGVALYLLQHRVDRQLIQPALQQHRRLLENLDFSSTVIDMAPVGICVLRRDDRACCCPTSCATGWAKKASTATGRLRGAGTPANAGVGWSSPPATGASCRCCTRPAATRATTCCCASSMIFPGTARPRPRCRRRARPPMRPTRPRARSWPP